MVSWFIVAALLLHIEVLLCTAIYLIEVVLFFAYLSFVAWWASSAILL